MSGFGNSKREVKDESEGEKKGAVAEHGANGKIFCRNLDGNVEGKVEGDVKAEIARDGEEPYIAGSDPNSPWWRGYGVGVWVRPAVYHCSSK